MALPAFSSTRDEMIVQRPIKKERQLTKIIMAISVFCLLCSCTPAGHEKPPNSNQIVLEVAEVPNGGFVIELDRYDTTDEAIGAVLESHCRLLGLPKLDRNADPEHFEFRLWTNLEGLGDTRLLAVRSDGVENRGDFFALRTHGGDTKSEKRKLAQPRSGWHNIAFPFTSRLTTPQGLRREPVFEIGRDEPLILLEVVQRGEYRRIFYGQLTKFPDGVKLMETCQFLAVEFGVELDCHFKEPKYFE